MKNKRIKAPGIVGGNTLFLIFSVLCLTVFTLLTISTALSDKRLSVVSADAVNAYYEADYEAERIFSMIKDGEIPSFVEVSGNLYTYECEISETQKLSVIIESENGEWNVLSWQTVSLGE